MKKIDLDKEREHFDDDDKESEANIETDLWRGISGPAGDPISSDNDGGSHQGEEQGLHIQSLVIILKVLTSLWK